jgi:hypothetical protein
VYQPLREELRIKMNALPTRLHVDQEAVLFLLDFFLTNPTGVTLKDMLVNAQEATPANPAAQPAPDSPPANNQMQIHPAYAALLATPLSPKPESKKEEGMETVNQDVYIQSFDCPMLWFCVDYKPNSVNFKDLQSGDYSQLLHIFPLEAMDVLLKPVHVTGAKGWDGLVGSLSSAWVKDLADHQVNRYLAGVQPIRSVTPAQTCLSCLTRAIAAMGACYTG